MQNILPIMPNIMHMIMPIMRMLMPMTMPIIMIKIRIEDPRYKNVFIIFFHRSVFNESEIILSKVKPAATAMPKSNIKRYLVDLNIFRIGN
jgi:hypothetical protein